MPTWGLTRDQMELGPWDLHPALLAPCKVTTDEVWGDIHTTVLEQAFVDTEPMQRLRRVRQLGTSHLVYPGATHTRFSHSLGALKVVQDLLDAVVTQREALHSQDDLLSQWQKEDEAAAATKIAEAIVLGRLGALLHDLCHVPFGHSIEDDLQVLVSHDENEARFERLWKQIEKQLPDRIRRYGGKEIEDPAQRTAVLDAAVVSAEQLFGDHRLAAQLRPLIISKDAHAKRLRDEGQIEYPFVADLVGDTICADLLDYLLRDHLNTGLPASLGKRFTSAFFAVPKGRGPLSERAALNIKRGGHERTDVVSELLKALRYRYELSERVLYHHAKLAADAMIGRALDLWSNAVRLEVAVPDLAQIENAEDLLEASDQRGLLRALKSQLPPRVKTQHDEKVRRRLENEFLAHGDDGLLERMAQLASDPALAHEISPMVESVRGEAASLASALLHRELFEVAGRVGVDDASAGELHARFGRADRRIELEDAAQGFAEPHGDGPQVLMWLPSPKMRIKLARVLVDDGRHINHFNSYEEARRDRGRDIYRADSHLWALWVFTRRDMSTEEQEAVLTFLADRLGVAWEQLVERYGPKSWTWMPRFALQHILEADKPTDAQVDAQLDAVVGVSRRSDSQLRTRSGRPRLFGRSDYVRSVRKALD
jgi:HD superfamily phosphohydrolase